MCRDQQEIWQADNVDAALIASSTDTHVDLLRQAMRAGKPTYCEKPIDLDIDKVRTVVAEAAESDQPIFMGFRRRFVPEFQQMRRRIREGAIGRIESIRIVARDFEPASLAYLHRSGGLLRDKMIHYFDLAPWLAAGEADGGLRNRLLPDRSGDWSGGRRGHGGGDFALCQRRALYD